MTTQTEALKLALEALSNITNYEGLADARKTIKEALAQPEHEPVAYLYHDASSLEELLEAERKCLNMHSVMISIRRNEAYRNETPLYTLQPQRTWVGLTDEDLDVCNDEDDVMLARYWERVCKENNK